MLGRFSNQIIAFVVSVFLARILSPSEFGLIGIVLSIISFSSIFFDFGFKSAIIQQQAVSKEELGTVFLLNVMAGVVLCLAFILSAGAIQAFYGYQELADIIMVSSLIFVFNSMTVVPSAILSKALKFKAISFVNIVAALSSGVLAILMAMNGWGVWSLATQAITFSFVSFAGLFIASKWKPVFYFLPGSIRGLWKFSSRVFLPYFLENLFSRLDVFIIGKIFTQNTLGYYTRAQSLDSFSKQFSSGSIVAVVLPYFAKIKDDRDAVAAYYVRSLHIICFLSLLLTGLLYCTAESLFVVLFTEKWLSASYIFQILALSGFVYPVSALMVNLILARGDSKGFLINELLKKSLLLLVFIFGFLNGLNTFLYLLVGCYWCMIVLNAWFVSRDFSISAITQLGIVARYILLGAGSVVAVEFMWRYFHVGALPELLIKGSAFVILYLVLSIIFRTPVINLIVNKGRSMLARSNS